MNYLKPAMGLANGLLFSAMLWLALLDLLL